MGKVVAAREIAAPIEAVWPAWSEPSYLTQWWGPDGFSCPSALVDFREGGSAVLCMRAPVEAHRVLCQVRQRSEEGLILRSACSRSCQRKGA